ncbi:unnamed protein product, partial [Ectocarpus sp. 12 AP-2014]
ASSPSPPPSTAGASAPSSFGDSTADSEASSPAIVDNFGPSSPADAPAAAAAAEGETTSSASPPSVLLRTPPLTASPAARCSSLKLSKLSALISDSSLSSASTGT